MMNPQSQQQRIDGILLVNKPAGLSSNGVLQRVKHLFSVRKAGHTGSLDPMATGMLPVCFGEATKFCQYLLDADKSYTATGVLGIKTNTADSTGEVVSSVDDFTISAEQLREVCASFIGTTQQIPSMFSALKHQGQPLYKLARAGREIERKARNITIHGLEITAFDGRQFQLTVDCTKGTYIRNLVEDIGERLGVGAHVSQLHRLHTAGFMQEPMVTVDELIEMTLSDRMRLLLPIERAVEHLPSLQLTAEQAHDLRHGRTISIEQNIPIDDPVRLYETGHGIIGLGCYTSPGQLKVKRLLSLEAEC